MRWLPIMQSRSIAIAGMVVLVLVLSGCAFTPKGAVIPTRSEVIGAWIHIGSNSKVELSNSGVITFTDVPKALIYGTDRANKAHKGEWTDLTTISGTWEAARSQHGAYPVIYFSIAGGGNALFYDSYTQSTTVLTLAYGDDVQYRFDFHRDSAKPTSTG
jgi:hypothetical protein